MLDDSATGDHYLVGLDLRGRRVVVVGGGSVAQRRIGLLVRSGAQVHVIAREATPTVESYPGISVSLRDYQSGDLDGAWYVLAATNDPAVNEQIVQEATDRRIFCVRADAAREGTAVTPATVRHDDLVVGVLASGDHRRSAALRNQIASILRGEHPIHSPDGDQVATAPSAKPTGVALVGGGPGDPDLITVRGRRLLDLADVVVADRLAPVELLDELSPSVEIIDAAKVPYGRAMQQDAINEVLIDRARAGKFVVRLKGGDPYVFGRGFEELLACVEAGIPVTVTPGITSPIAAPASADIPVTHRGVTHELVIVSGHVPPGHPDSLVNWNALGALQGTIVLMMAVKRLGEFADALVAGGRDRQTPVAVIENATTSTQRTVRGTLADIAEVAQANDVQPPAIAIIGSVAGLSPER